MVAHTLYVTSYLNVAYHLLGDKQNNTDTYNKFYLQFWRFTAQDPADKYLGKFDVTELAISCLKSIESMPSDDDKYIYLIGLMLEESNYLGAMEIDSNFLELRTNLNNMKAQIEREELMQSHCAVGVSSKKTSPAL